MMSLKCNQFVVVILFLIVRFLITETYNNICFATCRYTAPVADFTRHAMQKSLNPVFQDVTIPNMNILNINITRFIKEMREIDYQLHCSDDEDCKKFPYLFFAKCKDGSVEEFSGSGDSYDDSTESTSSGSTSIPRINNPIIILRPPNFNITLPPDIIYTDNMPTTALPTTEPDKSTVANTSGDNTTTTETSSNVTNNNNFSQITNNHHSGVSILHSELWHRLLPLLLGILYIF